MKSIVIAAMVFLSGLSALQVPADIEIVLKHNTPREMAAREQLRRLISNYELDPWLFTRKVVIESGAVPHSHPVLTLNTRHIQDDLMQLSTLLHEQAHWYLSAERNATGTRKAAAALQRMYPHAPSFEEIGTRSDQSTWRHLIVNWLELEAMRQLAGEADAREVLSRKDHYEWIYARVLEDTDRIGAILAEHDLVQGDAPY